MLKKISSMVMALMMVLSLTSFAFGEEAAQTSPAKVKFNKSYIEFSSSPVLVDGDIYAPYKELFDSLGIQGSYSYSEKIVKCQKGDISLELSSSKNEIKVDKSGVKSTVETFAVPVMKMDGGIYVSAQEVLSQLGIVCGYTADSSVLVVLDFAEIDKQFESDPSLSNYRELLKMSDSFEQGSMDVVYDIKGSYTDAESQKYDFSGKMNANILMNLPLMSAEISFADLKMSPETDESAIAVGMLGAMKYSMIMDDKDMYMKMPLMGSKWMKQPLDEGSSMDMSIFTKNSTVTKPSEILNLVFASSYELDENTYDYVEKGYAIFKEFFNNERVEITKKSGNTTEASFAISKEDVSTLVGKLVSEFDKEAASNAEMAEFKKFMETAKFNLSFNYLFTDNKLDNYKMVLELDMQIPDNGGSVSVDANINAKVEDKAVTIQIPKAEEIQTFDDMEGFELEDTEDSATIEIE